MGKKELSDMLNKISFWTLTIGAIMYAILLVIICILTPEVNFIKTKPLEFTVELIAFPTFACIPLVLFAYYRGLTLKSATIFIVSFWLKILLLHLLLEISGFYNWLLASETPNPS